MRNISYSLALSLVLIIGCSQQRSEQFAQGQGRDLYKVEQYHNKRFSLRTHAMIGGSPTHAANVTDIDAPKFDFYTFPIVAYDSPADLLGGVVFRGKPDTDYSVVYRLEDQYLKVYKVATKDLIPTDERPYAIQFEGLEKDEIAVPLVGYALRGYFEVQNQTNSYNEESHVLVEVPLNGFTANSYVRIDFLTRTVFEPVTVSDVFPAKFFQGEWYYSQTVTQTRDKNLNDSTTPGIPTAHLETQNDGRLRAASRLRFLDDSEHMLRGVNSAVAKKLRGDTKNYKSLLSIPAERIDLESESLGRSKGLRGVKKTTRSWRDREYVSLNLNEMQSTGSVEDFYRYSKQITDLVAQDNYLGLTILYPEQGIKVTHSFLRVEGRPEYKARSYPKGDFNLFGFFSTTLDFENTQQVAHDDDYNARVFVNRFNPATKNIVYHFRIGTSDDDKKRGYKGIEVWNEAFKKAGTDISVSIDKQDVNLGDLRYNIINYIESVSDLKATIYGYGPSVVDPDSGEIIAATANIYASQIRFDLIGTIREFIVKTIEGNNGHTVRLTTPIFQAAEKSGAQLLPLTFLKTEENEKSRARHPSVSFASDVYQKAFLAADPNDKSFDFNSDPKRLAALKNNPNCFGGIPINAPEEKVAKYCPKVMDLIKELKRDHVWTNAGEQAIVEACADALLDDALEQPYVHELGHNFGLLHNFKGSVDKPNFYPKEVTNTERVVETSSVMEYPSDTTLKLALPGLYDIAALRYSYLGQVETKDGALVNISDKKSLKEQVPNHRRFAYCDDDDALRDDDPLCKQWDEGTNAREVAQALISQYYSALDYGRFRRDRVEDINYSHLSGFKFRAKVMGIRLQQIYAEYRFQVKNLLKDMDKKAYLEGYTSENYAEFETAIQKKIAEQKAAGDSTLEEYYDASKMVEKFYLDIAFLPDHYCSYKDAAKGETELVPFRDLRRELWRDKGIELHSCRDESLRNHFKALGRENIDDVGYDYASTQFSLRDEDKKEPFDIIGSSYDRITAVGILSARLQPAIKMAQTDFLPAMTDNPKVRAELVRRMFDRINYGIDNEGRPATKDQKEHVNFLFTNEKDFLTTAFSSLVHAFEVPDDDRESRERYTPYMVTYDKNQSQLKLLKESTSDYSVAELSGGPYFYASKDESPIGATLISTYLKMRNKKGIANHEDSYFDEIFHGELKSEKENGAPTVSDLIERANGIAKGFVRLLPICDQATIDSLLPEIEALQEKATHVKDTLAAVKDEKLKAGSAKDADDYQKSVHASALAKLPDNLNADLKTAIAELEDAVTQIRTDPKKFKVLLSAFGDLRADYVDKKEEYNAQYTLQSNLLQSMSRLTSKLE